MQIQPVLRPLIVCLVAFAPAWPADQATGNSSAEPGISRQQADAILNELRAIRQLLEKQGTRPTPQAAAPAEPIKANLKIDGGEILGSKDAPLTMVEFTDYQCPFCRRFHVNTFPELKKQYIETGKLRYVVRDFPLDFHPNAMHAAEAAHCAAEQGKFWQMNETLSSNADKLAAADLTGYAEKIGLDMKQFQGCLDSGKHKPKIQQSLQQAASLKVEGTPAFVIGKSTQDGVDGLLVIGALPFQAFDQRLKELEGK